MPTVHIFQVLPIAYKDIVLVFHNLMNNDAMLVLQDFDSEKRKMICKTLRFVAHTYGAHLMVRYSFSIPVFSSSKPQEMQVDFLHTAILLLFTATLFQFFSAKDNTLLNKARAMVSHLLFETPGP